MRRVVPALALAGVLLSAAACGTARSPEPGTATAPAVAPTGAPAQPAPAVAQTCALCETLGQAYSEHLGPFAEALSATVADGGKTAQKQARDQLSGLADAITEATRANPDAQVQTDGAKAAGQLKKASTDDGLFRQVRSADDVNTMMGTTLKEWMAPVARHCS